MEVRLDGKVAVVTGSGRGIGEATAHTLAACGGAVVVADVDDGAGRGTAAAIEAAGGRARFIATDVSKQRDAAACVGAALEQFGALHYLVNNAGATLRKSLEETEPDEWDHVIGSNVTGCYLMSRSAIPAIRGSGGGAIVHIASWHARATIPRFAAYAASKGAIVSLTRQMALDCGPDGIRVNAVAPGIVDTRRWQGYLETLAPSDRERAERETLAMQPLGRIGTAQDVAHAIVFLLSDLAGYVSGTTLFVDGAMSARLTHI